MTLTDEQIRKAAEVLHKTVTDNSVKLAFGSRQRTANRLALERGERPSNYRIEWLKESRAKMVEILQAMAAEFNRKHPHDACSVLDLMDVLASTSYQFQQAVRRSEERKD